MTDPATPEGRAELRRLHEVATRMPWKVKTHSLGLPQEAYSVHSRAVAVAWMPTNGADPADSEADAHYIAAACNAIPALLKLVEDQQERIEELEDNIDSMEAHWRELRG